MQLISALRFLPLVFLLRRISAKTLNFVSTSGTSGLYLTCEIVREVFFLLICLTDESKKKRTDLTRVISVVVSSICQELQNIILKQMLCKKRNKRC